MFYFDYFYGKKILRSSLLSEYDCFFTTRDFVLTPSTRNDLEKEAAENKVFLKQKLFCSDIVTSKQIHSDNISTVQSGKYFYDNTDALISNIEGSLLLMNFADCVPIILYSKKDNTGAIVHAGWRGTAAKILKKTVNRIKQEYNIKASDITALIGPAIGKCCFETDENVFKQIIDNDSLVKFYEKKSDKYYIDLKLLNNHQLLSEGVENIDICAYCTCCMSDIFFSYRKEKGMTARHSAILKIKRG